MSFLASMEGDSKKEMQLRCALTLNKFMNENKSRSILNSQLGIEDLTLVDNLSKLSSSTGLRPATISSIFNADSTPSITTVILILIKLQKTLTDFGNYYESIDGTQIQIFESERTRKKNLEKTRKS